VHLTCGSLRDLQSFFYTLGFICFRALSKPTHKRVTQTVETVEKVPFQKLILEKWDRNTEKYLVFCIPHNILAIFEPVVGDFCEDFLQKEFFDSLVRWPSKYD
jgi:hypothetical protein